MSDQEANSEIVVSENENKSNPWDRIHNETAKAYGAFVIYMKFPANGPINERRSLRNTSLQVYGEDTQGKRRQLQTWASAFQWKARALAWDEEVERGYQDKILKDHRNMLDRQGQVGRAIQQLAINKLTKLSMQDADDNLDLSIETMLTFFAQGFALERSAHGEPDKTIEVEYSGDVPGGIDFTSLTVEELQIHLAKEMQLPANIVKETVNEEVIDAEFKE